MAGPRFLDKHQRTREWGRGSITLRAEKDAKGRPVPAKYDDAGAPLYKFLYRSPNGGSKVLFARSRDHAGELATDVERERAQVVAVQKVQQSSVAVLVDSFFVWKRGEGGASPATLDHYQKLLDKHVLPVLGTLEVAAVTSDDVTAMLNRARRESQLGPVANNTVATIARMVFDFAVMRSVIARNPVHPKLHRQKAAGVVRARRAALRDAMPTEKQLRAFIEQAVAYDDGTSAGPALALGMETGLRREELLHLRRQDVTLTPDLADLRVATDFPCHCSGCLKDGGKQRTKNRHERFVPLTKRAEKLVREQLARLERDVVCGPWLYPVMRHAPYMRFGAGSQMHREHLGAAVHEIAKAAGLTLPARVAVHFCRHVALSRWETAGLSQGQRDLASGHDAAGVRASYSHGGRQELYRAFREKLG